MPENKLQYYVELAEQTARQLTDSLENWTAFLDTAARLYKYPYHEQLMIYAQRPDATACADYDTWNKTMRRYICRGTKGIALLDQDGDIPKLKYVYDLADTGTRQNSRPVNLWQMEQEHMDSVFYTLEQNYGLKDLPLDRIFEEISVTLVDEFWDNHRRDITGIVDDSFLEEYTDDTIGVRFREAVTVSTTYTIMARCGMESPFTHEDFLPVFEFNTPDTIAALGTAVSQISEQVLRDIEITIKIYEKERIQRDEERTDLHQSGGLRLPEPDPAESAVEAPGQVRQDAPGIPEEPQTDPVQQIDSVGETALSPDRDRLDSKQPDGTDDGRAGESERRDGTDESSEPDAVGTDDEQPEIAGGGNDFDGADLQLTPPEPFGRGNQLSLFDLIPTEAEQITYIDKAESEPKTPFAFSFSQDEIDTVLRFGSNTDDHRKRIVAEFMRQKSLDENAEFLKGMYHGGNGFIVDNRDICAWYANGIHLAQGRSARYVAFSKVLDWEEAAERVGQMLEDGTFTTNVELAEAVSHTQRLLAIEIWNLHSYFSEEAHGKYYSSVMFDGTYPDSVDRITEMLADPFMRDVIAEETARLAWDYAQNRNLLRFHHARPDHLAVRIRELGEMTHEYTAELTELPAVRQFITEDEIAESFIRHGSGVYNGKHRIYDYLIGNHTDKEKIDFLKNEYGTGGHSHVLSGSTGSWEDHDSKGIRLRKPDCTDVEMSWTNVLKRLQDLIRKDKYLTQNEKDAIKAHYDAEKVYSPVKAEHPDDIVLYQFGSAFEMYGEDAKKAGDLLNRYVFERDLPGIGMVDMCNIDVSRLTESVEKLREQYSVTVISLDNSEWRTENFPKSEVKIEQEALSDRIYAEEHLIPEETMFTIGNKPYMVDRVDLDSLTVHYQYIGVIIPQGEEIFHSAPVDVIRRYIEIDDIKMNLTPEQQTIVEAFETGGFTFNPSPNNEIRFDDAAGYPMTYKTWEDAYAAIDSAELRDFPGMREEVQQILHSESPINNKTVTEEPQSPEQPEYTTKTIAVYPAEENHMPFEVVIQTICTDEPVEIPPENFRITDDDLGTGGAKAKFRMNMDAISTLKQIEAENRHATPEEQEILSKYVGWGGLADAFDDSKENWKSEYAELSAALTSEEYTAARSSTLNAHYTSPTVIKAIYEAVGNMGFQTGNILEIIIPILIQRIEKLKSMPLRWNFPLAV